MRQHPLIVLKFGGSVLPDEQRLRIAVHEIYRWRREGWHVVAVVSALAGETDALLAKYELLCQRPSPLLEAALVGTGEMEAAALLGLHLDRAGIPASVLTPGAARFRAEGRPLDAAPRSIDVGVFERSLAHEGVVVFPGFVSLDAFGRTVTLGRGGSDVTALFLAHVLAADRCRLVKDVDGLYEADPASEMRKRRPRPRRFERASYADALATDGSIIQHKAVRYAQSVGLEFEVGGFNGVRPTRIGAPRSLLADTPDTPVRLRVVLLGLGTVGGGVLELLRQMPEHFDVVGAAVRDPVRHAESAGNVPVSTDPVRLAAGGANVVVEAMGGLAPATAAIEAALNVGSDVVTANKALLAERGRSLRALARLRGKRILASAAVGGSMPAIERVSATPFRSIRGVLNGTTNFVLERLRHGWDFEAAITRAQQLGLAESEVERDLDGRDALDKLFLLAHWSGHISRGVQVQASEPVPRATSGGHRNGFRLRHVASLDRTGASVRLEAVGSDDALHDLPDEWNALAIEREDGRCEIIRGRGAGRWPTAESVVADLLELSRARSTSSGVRAEEDCEEGTVALAGRMSFGARPVDISRKHEMTAGGSGRTCAT